MDIGLVIGLIFVVFFTDVYCWELKKPGTDELCLSITGNLELNITYNKGVSIDTTQSAVHRETVPKDDVQDVSLSISGQCISEEHSNSSEISIKWGEYTLYFQFLKDSEKELWYTTSTQLTYNETTLETPFLPKTGQIARTSAQLFSTRESHKYQCNALKSYQLFNVTDDKETTDKTVVLDSSLLLIAPFQNLLDASTCTEDEKPTPKPKPKPTTKAPIVKPTTEKPKPVPAHNGASGSKVAWVCTILSVGVLLVSGVIIYVKREATPEYLTVI